MGKKIKIKKANPELFIKNKEGWEKVNDVDDVKIAKGVFELEKGQQVGGDVLKIFLNLNRYDSGQIALRKLAEMESRIVDLRVIGSSSLDISVIVSGVFTSDGAKHCIMCRVIGMRPVGTKIVDIN